MVSKFREFTGGVEAHIEQLSSLLEAAGHEVRHFTSGDLSDKARAFSADAMGVRRRLRGAVQLLWNSEAKAGLQKLVDEWSPDVVHHHSIYHQLSPSVLLPGCRGRSVMTLHDYKLAAPCYSLFREDKVCELCVGSRLSLPAIRYTCVQGSVAASTLCVVEDLLHHRRYVRGVEEFIVPSNFSADVMARAGIPRDRMNVIRWGHKGRERSASPLPKVGSPAPRLLYAGRLHRSKGIGALLEAWQKLPKPTKAELLVAGDGDLRGAVEFLASSDGSVSYLGTLDRAQLEATMQQVDAMLVPSLFPETFGLSAVESLVAGLPVIASTRGALSEFQGPGFIPIDDLSAVGLSELILRLESEPLILEVARQELATRDLSDYSGRRMLGETLEVYQRVSRK